jgi:hypothetical protein
LEIKKLKTFLCMLHGEQDTFSVPGKLPGRLRKFYHVAGDIRSLQLQRQYILNALQRNKDVQPVTYLNNLEIALAGKMQQAKDLLHGRHSFEREEQYIINGLPRRIGTKTIAAFARAEINIFWNLMSGYAPGDDILHQARRTLKNILYIWPYFDRNIAMEVKERLVGKNDIASMALLLGHNHDASMALTLLDTECINQSPGEGERLLLHTIRDQWLGQKAQIRQQVYDQLLEGSMHI